MKVLGEDSIRETGVCEEGSARRAGAWAPPPDVVKTYGIYGEGLAEVGRVRARKMNKMGRQMIGL